MAGYDLHTHSTCSDGTLEPEAVARLAVERQLGGIALTDHDTTAGVAAARAVAREHGVVVLTGCEFSAGHQGNAVHVLGVGFDPGEARFAAARAAVRGERLVRARRTVDRLRALGAEVTFEQVRALAAGESVGRPHIAQAMVEAGVVPSVQEAFGPDWIGAGGRAYVPKQSVSPVRAVELIRGAGGVAILAHPSRHAGNRSVPEAVIREMVAAGLAALEADHPDQPGPDRAHWRALAAELEVLTTGGSDDHGARSGYRLGVCRTSEATVAALLAASPTASQR
ncbi:MAG TPA: PHP domain-containing protein [Actinomycetes bacterium]|nr:PHP domain-containing protein [Actinomycetes bacterium]